MCEPTTIAAVTLAVSAAAAGASYYQGQQNIQATGEAAARNAQIQNQALEEQRTQIGNQAANDITERARAAQIEQGKLRVIAGESGALGLTQDRLLQDSAFQAGTDIATIQSNRDSSLRQTDLTGLANYNQNTSIVNQAKNKAPTLLGTGLQIGMSGLSAYSGYQKSTRKEP